MALANGIILDEFCENLFAMISILLCRAGTEMHIPDARAVISLKCFDALVVLIFLVQPRHSGKGCINNYILLRLK